MLGIGGWASRAQLSDCPSALGYCVFRFVAEFSSSVRLLPMRGQYRVHSCASGSCIGFIGSWTGFWLLALTSLALALVSLVLALVSLVLAPVPIAMDMATTTGVNIWPRSWDGSHGTRCICFSWEQLQDFGLPAGEYQWLSHWFVQLRTPFDLVRRSPVLLIHPPLVSSGWEEHPWPQ